MKSILIFPVLLFSNLLIAQQQANNWFFGNNSAITFNTIPPTYLSGSSMNTNEGCSSISDSTGNLLFYSDGVNVWDSSNNTMPNSCCLNGGNSSTQSCLIVPYPGNSSKYYVLTPPDMFSNTPLSYSIVDMTLNGGLGDVTVKNSPLLDSTTEKITAVRHQNYTDIWIISHSYQSSDFYAWLITPSGVSSTPVISTTGSFIGNNTGNKVGYLKASPCGNKLANAQYSMNILELFDFDNSTGIITNPIQLFDLPDITNGGVYGVEFSPDGTLLYASINADGRIIQYDLLAGSPQAIIASSDTIAIAGSNSGALQIGPDQKIYLSRQGQNSLDCIQSPNLQGLACNFTNNYVQLTTLSRIGLPNFLTSYFCNANTGINQAPLDNLLFSIYPNPSQGNFIISLSKTITKGNIEIYNIFGVTIYMENFISSTKKEIHLKNISSGIYFVKVFDGEKSYCKKLIVEHD